MKIHEPNKDSAIEYSNSAQSHSGRARIGGRDDPLSDVSAGSSMREVWKREIEASRALAVLLCLKFSFTDPQRTFSLIFSQFHPQRTFGLMLSQFHRKHFVLERGRTPSMLGALRIIIYSTFQQSSHKRTSFSIGCLE